MHREVRGRTNHLACVELILLSKRIKIRAYKHSTLMRYIMRKIVFKLFACAAIITSFTASASSQTNVDEFRKVKIKIDSQWRSLGNQKAKIAIVAFEDYQCPYCESFHKNVFQEIKSKYIDTGKIIYSSRDLPLDFHPMALPAAIAAHCANEMGKFWQMHDALLSNQKALNRLGKDAISQYADEMLINKVEFNKCIDENRYGKHISKDIEDAGSLGITGTPSFIVGIIKNGEIDGIIVPGAYQFEVFDAAIKSMIGRKNSRSSKR